MLFNGILNVFFDAAQFLIGGFEVNFLFAHRCADVSRDVQVEVVLLDLGHLHSARVAGFLCAILIGFDDFLNVLGLELILLFAFLKVLGGVDEQHIVGFLALLEHEDADGDSGGVEEIGWQADDGVDVAVLEQFGADSFLSAASEEDAVGQDDRHHTFVFEVVEAVEQECEVGGGLGGEAVAFEAYVVGQCFGRFPTKAEGSIGHDGVEARLLGRVELPHYFPLVE